MKFPYVELVALAMAPERHASGGGIGSVIDFPAERGEPNPLPEGGPFKHTDEVDADEPNWNAVDDPRRSRASPLPRWAWTATGRRGIPAPLREGATAKDNMGADPDGKMFLHKGQLEKMLGHADMMHLELARARPPGGAREGHRDAVAVANSSSNHAAAQSAAADPDAIALAAGRDGQQVKAGP